MTTHEEELTDIHPSRQRIAIVLAVAATVPAMVLRLSEPALPHPVVAVLFGLAIVGSAFILSWAAEVAQLDISAGLAIAVLALIAVLPEYAVDFVFAWKGGEAFEATGPACLPPPGGGEESPCSLALANMTGANRLLIGIGWSMVVFIAWYRLRKRDGKVAVKRWEGVQLHRGHSVELAYLAAATVYSLTLPLKHSITPFDAVVLISIFVMYSIRVSKAPAEEPHLVGPARYLGTFGTRARRASIITMFIFAGAVILICAERFAEALVLSGKAAGINEFFLVQWLAPLASEAPELLIAGLYAWRLNTNAGLGTLVSSKVNQWTLLVGTLPIVFSIAAGGLHGLPIDEQQREELFLTAAQSFYAVAILANLSMSIREAWLLFGLFWAQFIVGALVPEAWHAAELIGVGIIYLLLGMRLILRDRARLPKLLRDGFRTPHAVLYSTGDPPAGNGG